MPQQTATKLEAHLKKAITLSQCLGLFPLELSDAGFSFSVKFFLISIAYSLFFGYATLWVTFLQKIELILDLGNISLKCYILLVYIQPVMCIVCSLVKASQLNWVLNELRTIESLLPNSGKGVSRSYSNNIAFVSISSEVLNFLVVLIFNKIDIIRETNTVVSSIALHILASNYASLFDIFHSKFKSLNKNLNDYCDNENSVDYAVYFIKIECQLRNSLLALNRIYSLQFLLYSIRVYFKLVFTLYIMYEKIVAPETGVMVIINSILRLSAFLLPFLYFINRIAEIIGQAQKFNSNLYQLVTRYRTNQWLNNEKIRLHIAMNEEVVVTAFGMFNMDYSLVYSMVATAVTYLVILIQFKKGS